MSEFETKNWKSSIPVDEQIVIHPDPRIVEAFQNIGYSPEAAIADLTDNSIDAGAHVVLIRFLRTNEELHTLVVADNGKGMSARSLDRAMQFGGQRQYEPGDLGMYGMGLKSASLSQADSLTVLTRAHGHRPVGRRWRAAEARAGWKCDVVSSHFAASELNRLWHSDLRLIHRGTIVRWDDVRDFRKAAGRVDSYLQKLRKTLGVHLGLQLHRFLEGDKPRLRIIIDSANLDTGQLSPPASVTPLNPFSYPRAGAKGYPKTFHIDVPGIGKLKAQGHIWPPRTKVEGYKLGGGAVARRQGFYFYRHERLLQAGGWNQYRDDTEPHLSLARVEIDLTPEFESFFAVRFNKSAIDAPRSFADALDNARASDGTTFLNYVDKAIDVYRAKPERELPAVFAPGRGLRTTVEAAIRRTRTVLPRHQIDITWETLPAREFFRLDRLNDTVILNKTYRHILLAGRPASRADLPVIKTLLYLLNEDLFHSERQSGLERERLASFQAALIAAAKEEMH